ncbi:hypothetical protein BKA80DRAFT_105728 [Phyllosticta citrichinensis]
MTVALKTDKHLLLHPSSAPRAPFPHCLKVLTYIRPIDRAWCARHTNSIFLLFLPLPHHIAPTRHPSVLTVDVRHAPGLAKHSNHERRLGIAHETNPVWPVEAKHTARQGNMHWARLWRHLDRRLDRTLSKPNNEETCGPSAAPQSPTHPPGPSTSTHWPGRGIGGARKRKDDKMISRSYQDPCGAAGHGRVSAKFLDSNIFDLDAPAFCTWSFPWHLQWH